MSGRWTVGRLAASVALAGAAWMLLALLSLLVGSTGSVGVPRGIGGDVDWRVLELRGQHVLTASLVGAALGAAGVAYQAILRNPLADPYLLGVSSGAMLAAFAWQLGAVGAIAAVGQPLAAFTGAVASVAVVLGIARRRGRVDPVYLLLVGVIVNSFNASCFMLLNALVMDPATPGGPLRFLVGGFDATPPATLLVAAAAPIAAGWATLLAMSGSINAARLSDAEAASLGVDVQRLRWTALVVASLMTAAAVAVSGPIGFVGLIAPHLMRVITGADPRRLIPAATAAGASLLCLADAATRLLARQDLAGTALPVGVLTALLGGPFFLVLLLRGRRTDGA